MVTDDITGGLLLAVQKGETLEQAMLSFFNAGYKREKIEMAARTLQTLPEFSSIIKNPQPQPQVSLKPTQKLKKLPQTSQIKYVKKLNPILQNVPKAIKSSITREFPKEPSSKGPLSLSKPTSKLDESFNEPPKPHSQTFDPMMEFQGDNSQQQMGLTEPSLPINPQVQPQIGALPEIQPTSQKNVNSLASSYGGNRSNTKSVMIWILSFILIALVLFLGGVFLFRDSLIEFFNNLL